MTTKTIKVDYLARVEGEGAFHLKIEDEKVTEAHLKIFEPPRFFEAFMRGRHFTEAPDITSRICGICPIAYMMSSAQAMEDAIGLKVPDYLHQWRRLIYCGEWIESHVLHMVMLHVPDFLGFDGAVEMARTHGEWVQLGLRVKKAGNDIVNLLGGREIHPINIRVGGFYKLPTRKELAALKETLSKAREESIELLNWLATFDFPELTRDYLFVSLTGDEVHYPITEGHLITNEKHTIELKDYETYFIEEHIAYTNALHSHFRDGRSYLVGPIARYNLCFDKLSPLAKEAAKNIQLERTVKNPFKSLLVRGVETIYAFDEAIRIIDLNLPRETPSIEPVAKAGVGFGCSEAPRGALWHRYKIDEQGEILEAKIVPPTSQNQKTIEADLIDFAKKNMTMSDEDLKWHCEQAIRNYDPCISCATHFLKLNVERV